MAEAGLGFRTFTRAYINKYYTSGGTTLSVPIALPMPPESVELNPGVSLQKLKAKALQGSTQTVFTFDQEREAILTMQFGAASPDLEQLITGRAIASEANVTSFVYHEILPTATTTTALGTNEYGYYVAEQSAADALTNGTKVYRIDQATSIAVPVTVVDYASAPATPDEIAIGASLAMKFHADAVGTYTYYIKVPATFPTAVKMNSTVVTQVGVTLWGVTFDGSKTRILNAQYCSLNYGTSLSAEPQRQVSLEILSDPNDGTGLGYSTTDVPYAIAA